MIRSDHRPIWQRSMRAGLVLAFLTILGIQFVATLASAAFLRYERSLVAQQNRAYELDIWIQQVQGDFLLARSEESRFLEAWRMNESRATLDESATTLHAALDAARQGLNEIERLTADGTIQVDAPHYSTYTSALRTLLDGYEQRFNEIEALTGSASDWDRATRRFRSSYALLLAYSKELPTDRLRDLVSTLTSHLQLYLLLNEERELVLLRDNIADLRREIPTANVAHGEEILAYLATFEDAVDVIVAADGSVRTNTDAIQALTHDVSRLTDDIVALNASELVRIQAAIITLSRESFSILIIARLLGLAFIVWVMWRLADRALVPLEEMRKAAEAVGRGDLTHQFRVSNHDEYGLLSNTFNDMMGQIRSLVTDLESRVQARTLEARQREHYYRLLLERTPLPIVIYDSANLVDYLNPAFTAQFGWSLEEMRANGWHYIPVTYHPLVHQAQMDLARKLEVNPLQLELLSKSGSMREVRANVAHYDDLMGERQGTIVILRDITASNEQARQLHEAKEAAEAANRAKSEFLATMTHELRTPLTVIIGYAELIQEELRASEVSQSAISFSDKIILSGRHLLGIIGDILDFARIEAGRLDLVAAPFDLRAMLQECVGLMQASASTKEVTLALDYAGALPDCFQGDMKRLRQVFINLMGNAIKFTDEGTVRVTVSGSEDADPSLYRLAVTVQDTGIGISAEMQHRLFKAFSQVDSSTTRSHGGAGLGLVISSRLIQMMGGEITVVSTPGEGSAFTVSLALPLCDPIEVPGS